MKDCVDYLLRMKTIFMLASGILLLVLLVTLFLFYKFLSYSWSQEEGPERVIYKIPETHLAFGNETSFFANFFKLLIWHLKGKPLISHEEL